MLNTICTEKIIDQYDVEMATCLVSGWVGFSKVVGIGNIVLEVAYKRVDG
jgi:hypothetical protein